VKPGGWEIRRMRNPGEGYTPPVAPDAWAAAQQYEAVQAHTTLRNRLLVGGVGTLVAGGAALGMGMEALSTQGAAVAQGNVDANGALINAPQALANAEFAVSTPEAVTGPGGSGSCGPLSPAEARSKLAANPNQPAMTEQDLTSFFSQHTDRAAKIASAMRQEEAPLLDKLIPQGKSNPQALFGSMKVNRLKEDLPILNTFCDAQGNVIKWRAETLQAGTDVFAFEVIGGVFARANGESVQVSDADLANSIVVKQDGKTLIVELKDPCFNELNEVVAGRTVVTTPETTPNSVVESTSTTLTKNSTTTSTAPKNSTTTTLPKTTTTSTTVPQTSTTSTTVVRTTSTTIPVTTSTTGRTNTTRVESTVPAPPPIGGPGAGGSPDTDNNPDNNVTTSISPNTVPRTTEPDRGPATTVTRPNGGTTPGEGTTPTSDPRDLPPPPDSQVAAHYELLDNTTKEAGATGLIALAIMMGAATRRRRKVQSIKSHNKVER
jgi:hypothetical protein